MDGKSVSSRLRELVKFLATVQGDLSNVTGPPSLLAPSSVVEAGQCWAERPAVFAAPALEPDVEKRSLLVLKWFLTSLRSQLYVAGAPGISIRKPLNAFLGELFLASWTDAEAKASTSIVAEQVSHHPPITAMHVADKGNGIRADGYARVEMTFNGSVNIRQVGHAVLHIDRYDEDYLVPLPDVKVRGFLSGCMYPEITGTYTIAASSGFVAEVRFSGEGLIRGKRNAFEARVFRKDDAAKRSIYEVSGIWSDGWTAKDARTGEVMEKYVVDAPENATAPMSVDPVDAQDPWESRRAWGGVLSGMAAGDMRTVLAEKTRIEQAQRQMRACEAATGHVWRPLLFRSLAPEDHAVFHTLSEGIPVQLNSDKTNGVWRIEDGCVDSVQRPFRGELTPLG
ncbi:hypothetical protein B0T26DRAFT_714411 [Lasiosphaeria miniovina]|uniref:Oxysterol-binding protein n=1 Tax=Lasiosphaeria miniovina TaxID=1954250 RepID=A0AA40AAS8_9PEZI|nr:uncharacterized protein B0T26DRAFT_714411 [Lasiosphaeria miniovina]KAK0712470.1 hypothetical protein B0T26DRAFT_714411 [Lasiosphaeria miniovina]